MSAEHNVGRVDKVVRIVLGFACLGMLGYHFIAEAFLPVYGIIALLILIPYFLKTGFTRICPIMKSMNISTVGRNKQ